MTDDVLEEEVTLGVKGKSVSGMEGRLHLQMRQTARSRAQAGPGGWETPVT